MTDAVVLQQNVAIVVHMIPHHTSRIHHTSHIRRRTSVAVALTVATVLTAACGSSNDESASTSAPTDAVTTAVSGADTTAAVTTTAPPAETTVAPTTTVQDLDVSATAACDSTPVVLTTEAGVDFVRTPDSCFDNLVNWPYETKYLEIDGLRQAYIDEGPADGEVVLLLHGQPSWSYLYNSMIPTLVEDGYRVIAMDHLGLGRSDKPTELSSYSFDGHLDRLVRFVDELGIRDANLFAQDWGSVLGLWAAADHPDMFKRIAIGNGGIPNVYKRFDVPAEADASMNAAFDEFDAQIKSMPEQQPPLFDADGKPLLPASSAEANPGGFSTWASYSRFSDKFSPSAFVEALTYRALSPEEEAGYAAPFPSRDYMGGPRAFPTLLSDLAGRTDAQKAKLTERTTPLITIFGGNDPGLVGEGDGRPFLIEKMPGAAGQDHHTYPDASHFLQEDTGPDIAARVDAFIKANPV
jgi:haloalkane dehalogenase